MFNPKLIFGFLKSALHFLVVISLFSFSNCLTTEIPTKENVPEGAVLPIDGAWESYPPGQKVKIEKGRMFLVEAEVPAGVTPMIGSVLAKNIKQTGTKSYVCEWTTIVSGSSPRFTPTIMEAPSSMSLIFHVPLSGIGGAEIPARDYIYNRLSTSEQTPSTGDAIQNDEVKIRLDQDVKRVEESSELIDIPPGVVIEIKRSRTIEHTVNLESKGLVELKLDANFYDFLKGSIRAQIETSLGKSFKQSETLEHKITLDGNKARQYKLIWYDKIRTGTAEFKVDNKPANVPFTFREWEDLDVVAVESQK